MTKKLAAPRPRYIFTKEQRSKGGAEARAAEKRRGIRLNHGQLFGKRDKLAPEVGQ